MKRKTIYSCLISIGILFGLSSCGCNKKYYEGEICGNASAEGTNVYSEVRRYYCEQYVYEYNLDTYSNDEIYKSKFVIRNNALVAVSDTDDDAILSHYLFYYLKDNKTLVDTYVASTLSPDDVTAMLNKTYHGETDGSNNKHGYINKISNMSYDGDSTDSCKSVEERMKNYATSSGKACLVYEDGFIDNETHVSIPKTTWKQAFDVGLLYGLFVYPIGWLINTFVVLFGGSGWACIGGIVTATILLKLLVLLFTFKSQSSTQKMQDIQPEILKIQAKYGQNPNSEDKQKMSMEMMQIYQKYGVKPLAPFASLLITFPIFIAMYRAVAFLAILRQSELYGVTLGKNLNTYIIGGNFKLFALIIFIIMAASQIASMKLPQLLNKNKMTKSANDAAKQSQNMTNVMMIMILVMGFMMPVVMSIYWISSAIVAVIQSLIMHKLNNSSKKSGQFKMKKKESPKATIPQGFKI